LFYACRTSCTVGAKTPCTLALKIKKQILILLT